MTNRVENEVQEEEQYDTAEQSSGRRVVPILNLPNIAHFWSARRGLRELPQLAKLVVLVNRAIVLESRHFGS